MQWGAQADRKLLLSLEKRIHNSTVTKKPKLKKIVVIWLIFARQKIFRCQGALFGLIIV